MQTNSDNLVKLKGTLCYKKINKSQTQVYFYAKVKTISTGSMFTIRANDTLAKSLDNNLKNNDNIEIEGYLNNSTRSRNGEYLKDSNGYNIVDYFVVVEKFKKVN